MFDFFKKKLSPSESSAPAGPACLLSADGFDTYKIELNLSETDSQVEEVVDKLLRTMSEMKISNEVAMRVPAALHTAIAQSFEWCIFTTTYKPLVHDRDDQRNNGDNQSEN